MPKYLLPIIVFLLSFFTGRTVLAWVEPTLGPIYDPIVSSQKAYYPSVLKMGPTDYRMWYQSNNALGASTIALATSTDGITWTISTNEVSGLLPLASHPIVEFVDGKYRIWYWNSNAIYENNAIHYAESINGINWTNDQSITGNLFNSDWNRGTYGAVDLIINNSPTNSGTYPFDYKYAMYFDATTGGLEQIGLGYSSNGIAWTLYGSAPVFAKGTTGSWDSAFATFGTIIKDDIWRMWYSGGITSSNDGIGCATSTDGLVWTRCTNNPLMNKNDGVAWRNNRTYTPSIIKDGDTYKMWFTGRDSATSNYAIGYATQSQPSKPNITSPINGSTSVNINPSLVASAFGGVEAGVTHINTIWELDESSNFSSPEWTRISSTGEINTTINSANGIFTNNLLGKSSLDNDTTYYLRVKYEDSRNYFSDYSNSINFAHNSFVPTVTPVPTITAVPTATPRPATPTIIPIPTTIPLCVPICTNMACGADSCGGVCGTCLTGFSCSSTFACTADSNFDETLFVNDWNKLSSTLNIDISLGFQPEDISVGVDGNSLSGFRFYGQTSPKTLVHLYIFSDPIFKSTQSDENGNWSVTVSDPLPSGTHKVYAVAVVEGVGSKNSNVVSFSIDSASKAIAMGGIENLPLTGNGLPQTGETTTVTDTPTNNVWIYILCCSGLVLFGVLIFIIYKKKKKKDSK